jgi:site-specific DNA recombinase
VTRLTAPRSQARPTSRALVPGAVRHRGLECVRPHPGGPREGLASRPTAKRGSVPVSLTGMHHLLQNPYYMGVVSYQGIHYEGKHQPLIESETWLAIQDTLASHNHTGEKDRTHPHYLRGTIYCSACGGRLVYSENTGNGGTYKYYFCVKKKTKANNCTRPAMRLGRIEDGIAAFYERFRLTPELTARIQVTVHAELDDQQRDAAEHLKRALRRKQQAEDERQKLLQAHYAGAVPQDLLVSEMQRFTRALAEAHREIQACQATNADITETLSAALKAAEHCPEAYRSASPQVRRQINQGFFKKLYIGEDGEVERRELTEPFAALLDGPGPETGAMVVVNPAEMRGDETGRCRPGNVFRTTFDEVRDDLGGENDGQNETTPGEIVSFGRGLNAQVLVGAAGFEPATPSL